MPVGFITVASCERCDRKEECEKSDEKGLEELMCKLLAVVLARKLGLRVVCTMQELLSASTELFGFWITPLEIDIYDYSIKGGCSTLYDLFGAVLVEDDEDPPKIGIIYKDTISMYCSRDRDPRPILLKLVKKWKKVLHNTNPKEWPKILKDEKEFQELLKWFGMSENDFDVAEEFSVFVVGNPSDDLYYVR